MANATNQKKGIVTRGSGHIAESRMASLAYFQDDRTGPTVMDDNHIETSKCATQEAARRTFIESHNVLHHQSRIGNPHGGGPSTYDRQHGFAQKNPKAYGWFACPQENSPDTMVEGRWVVRTNDKCWQDGGNGEGKFSPAAGLMELLDESELLFQQCAVDRLKLECGHGRSGDRELHVLIGDTVKVTAYRVNASESAPEKRLDVRCDMSRFKARRCPPAEETRHAAFVVTRNGRHLSVARRWDEINDRTLVGKDGEIAVPGSTKVAKTSVIELKEHWLLKEIESETGESIGPLKEVNRETGLTAGPALGSYESHDIRQDGANTAHDHVGQARVEQTQRRLDAAKAKPGGQRKNSRAIEDAGRQANRAKAALKEGKEQRGQNQESAKRIKGQARLLVDSYKILSEIFLFQPLTINIEAHGCSASVWGTIKAYPPEPFGAELFALKDFAAMKTLQTLKSYVTAFSDFWKAMQGCNLRQYGLNPQLGKATGFNIDVFVLRSLKNALDASPSAELGLEWKELTRDSNPAAGEAKGRKAWQVHRSWELDLKLERLLGLLINFEIDLNYCLGLGRVIADILKFLGVKTGVFLDIDINLCVGVAGTITVNEYGKWGLNAPTFPLKAVIRLSLVARVGRFFEVAFRVIGRWEPKFKFGINKRHQAVIGRLKSVIHVILLFEAKVDILGWDLEAVYELKKWRMDISPTEFPLFGGGP